MDGSDGGEEEGGWKAEAVGPTRYGGATNFQWRQLLKLHARQINHPLPAPDASGKRSAIPGLCQQTLLLIFKFEDGKVARERNRIYTDEQGQMNARFSSPSPSHSLSPSVPSWSGKNDYPRKRSEIRVRRARESAANNQNGRLIQMESGYT